VPIIVTDVRIYIINNFYFVATVFIQVGGSHSSHMDEVSLYISIPLKLDPTIFKSPERMVLTHPHIFARAILLAPLSDDDIARDDRLARHIR
jgi:hypothetical protein